MDKIIDGAEIIKIERDRQKLIEGYTSEHDEKHSSTILLTAALAYVFSALGYEQKKKFSSSEIGLIGEDIWPWEKEGFKPRSKHQDMKRAGALMAAAIDRHLIEHAKANPLPLA